MEYRQVWNKDRYGIKTGMEYEQVRNKDRYGIKTGMEYRQVWNTDRYQQTAVSGGLEGKCPLLHVCMCTMKLGIVYHGGTNLIPKVVWE